MPNSKTVSDTETYRHAVQRSHMDTLLLIGASGPFGMSQPALEQVAEHAAWSRLNIMRAFRKYSWRRHLRQGLQALAEANLIRLTQGKYGTTLAGREAIKNRYLTISERRQIENLIHNALESKSGTYGSCAKAGYLRMQPSRTATASGMFAVLG